jgi:hypothetical protein
MQEESVMNEVAHTFPEFKSVFGVTLREVLVDGHACHWRQGADGKWECVPRKGGDCDNGFLDDGCRSEARIFGGPLKFTIIYRCMCQNSAKDLLASEG